MGMVSTSKSVWNRRLYPRNKNSPKARRPNPKLLPTRTYQRKCRATQWQNEPICR